LKKLLAENGTQHIIGKGYYAFMNVAEFIKAKVGQTANRSANISLKITA